MVSLFTARPDLNFALLSGLVLAIAIQRVLELRLAARNEAWARKQGAVEFGADHYRLFFVLHTAWLLAWPTEAWLRGLERGAGWPAWVGAFAAAEALRYWAITSLGSRWNTRVLVLPGAAPLRSGPYRWFAHPNYVAVALELFAVPMIWQAGVTAVVTGVLNLALLLGIRIPCETRALAWATHRATPSER